jgi:opacity protein-like surface antigen
MAMPSGGGAPDTGPAGEGDVYAGIMAGFALPDGLEIRLDGQPGELEFEGGFAAQGALGYRVSRFLRAEIEVGYIGAEVDRLDMAGGTVEARGDIATFSMMANAVAAPWEAGSLRPYAGAGIGAGRVSADAQIGDEMMGTLRRFDRSETGFAYQGFVGVAFDAINGGTGRIGYRYFATLGIDAAEMDMFEAELDTSVHVFSAGIDFAL